MGYTTEFDGGVSIPPPLWCWWEPTRDGTAIKWNGVEKFYN